MDNYDATEIAYKNGYEQGRADALKWIPVAEKLPEKKGSYLTYNSNSRSMHVTHFSRDDDYWRCVWETCVTYWMPLPEQPNS